MPTIKMIETVIGIISIIIISAYYFSISTFSYWEKKGVKYLKPTPIFGNAIGIVTKGESLGQSVERAYNQFPDEKYVGFYLFRNPQLIIKDLELLRQITVKDFDVFVDRGLFAKTDVFHENLLTGDAETWRLLRPKLSPVFTSGKLKKMLYLIEKCGTDLQNYIEKLINNNRTVEIRELVGKYTMEVIGSCAFGIECGVYKDTENINTKMMNKYIDRLSTQVILEFLFGSLLKQMGITLTSKDVKNFYLDSVKEIINDREGKPKTRHDLIDILMELREKNSLKHKNDDLKDFQMTDVLITAQAVNFFAAGFDTSAGLLSFMLYELALNEDIQEKLRKEVDEMYEKYGDITYDSINEMEYLEMVRNETLRKYPVVKVTFRIVQQDYKIPGEDLTIEKGTTVIIPISAIHNDANFYEEPKKFIPERFKTEKILERPPFSFIPFGEGPRHCIGKRFAKMTSSVCISKILRKYKVVPNEKTERNLIFRSKPGTLLAANGIWLDFKMR